MNEPTAPKPEPSKFAFRKTKKTEDMKSYMRDYMKVWKSNPENAAKLQQRKKTLYLKKTERVTEQEIDAFGIFAGTFCKLKDAFISLPHEMKQDALKSLQEL